MVTSPYFLRFPWVTCAYKEPNKEPLKGLLLTGGKEAVPNVRAGARRDVKGR